ncbi:DHHW family protein [Anaerosporobacter sp.]|uniref:DHHW family protein n=1 Tax=Anaerosporobacter sp. TaxID=1872529 RepID=UPI00286F7404|nr:DHHW family protein [Anaerosporobacter sp.]
MNNNERKHIYYRIKIVVFVVILFGGMILGAIYTLRPKYSDIEKRELQNLPKPEFSTVWDGQYFSTLTTWYADTYPFREELIKADGVLDDLYGIQTEQITGSAVVADEIPEVGNEEVAQGDMDLTFEEEGDFVWDEVEVDETSKNDDLEDAQKDTDIHVEDTTTEDAEFAEVDEQNTTVDDNNIAKDKGEKEEPVSVSKKDINNGQTFGSIYVTKERSFSLYYFSLSAADNYAKTINKIAKKLDGVANVYDLLAPTSVGIYVDEEKSKMIGSSDQKAAFDYIYSKLSKKVKAVDAIDNIKSHNKEYLYFKTDHHWTALGAYYAYEKFCETKGIKPNPLSSFEKREYTGFLGAYYAATDQSKLVKKNIDTIEAYVPMGTNSMVYTDKQGVEHNWPIVNDVSKYKENSKYSTFVAGDNPYSVITNKNSKSKETCVVIKESYGNAMIPFLVDHYRKIYIVDYRYYKGSLTSLVKKKKINDVIFVNNAEAINNTVVSLIDKIK